jgi:hypothetical protein
VAVTVLGNFGPGLGEHWQGCAKIGQDWRRSARIREHWPELARIGEDCPRLAKILQDWRRLADQRRLAKIGEDWLDEQRLWKTEIKQTLFSVCLTKKHESWEIFFDHLTFSPKYDRNWE